MYVECVCNLDTVHEIEMEAHIYEYYLFVIVITIKRMRIWKYYGIMEPMP